MTEKMPERLERKDEAERSPETVQPDVSNASGNIVFVGNKPVMNYVLACITRLSSGSNKVVIKARGRAIPRAVDTLEVLRRSFAKSMQVDGINLSTEEVTREQGQKSRVSAIEISIVKQ